MTNKKKFMCGYKKFSGVWARDKPACPIPVNFLAFYNKGRHPPFHPFFFKQ